MDFGWSSLWETSAWWGSGRLEPSRLFKRVGLVTEEKSEGVLVLVGEELGARKLDIADCS